MIEILFVVDYLTTNVGGPRFHIDVFRRLPKNSYRIHIVAGAVDHEALDILKNHSNINVVNLNVFNTKALPSEQPINVIKFLYGAFNTINKITKKTHIDVIHLNTHFPNLLSYVIKLITPIVCSIHHLEEATQFYGVTPKIAKLIIQDLLEINSPCNVIHVPSRYTKQRIEELSITNRNNIIVIPPGIEIEKYISIPRRMKESLFVMIGRLERRKHYEHAIAAFKIVTRHRPDYKLAIIGDGPLKHELIQMIKRYGLERNIFLLGSVDEETKLELLSKAEALIHLGYPEGFGIVILEALASGTPVIAYNVPPINEIVKNDVAGILVEKDNVMDLAKAIMSIDRYSFDPEVLRRITEKYDIKVIAKKFENLYKCLITQSKQSTIDSGES